MVTALPPTPISPYLPLPASPDGEAHDLPAAGDPSNTEQPDLFPHTSLAVSQLTQPLDPTRVPLPPSPTGKPRLPSNKPADWISSLPRSFSAAFDDSPGGAPASRGARSVSARLPSGPDPLRIGGRTISGAMQHAMRPDSAEVALRDVAVPHSDDGVLAGDDRIGASGTGESAGPSTHSNGQADGLDDIPVHMSGHGWDNSTASTANGADESDMASPAETIEFGLEEIRHSVLGMSDQDHDEVWMQHVRHQLGTLFPDFFHPADHPTVPPGSHAPLDEGNEGWAMVQDGAHRRPGTLFPAALGGDVPNVREEISGLRDEIERLRGVVGGLADGLRGPAVEQGVLETRLAALDQIHDFEEGAMGDDGEEEDEGQSGTDGQGVSESKDETREEGERIMLPAPFIKTAHLAVDLIRSLSRAVTAQGQSGPALDDQDQQAQDEAVFEESNLIALKEFLLLRLSDDPIPDRGP